MGTSEPPDSRDPRARRKRGASLRLSGLGGLCALGALLAAAGMAWHASGPAEAQQSSAGQGFPLPRFEGAVLGGGRAGTDLFAGRRGLVYVFASSDVDGLVGASVISDLEEDARAANIALLGVSRDLDPDAGRIFVEKHGFEFPVIVDFDLDVSRKLQVAPGRSAVFIVDGSGQIVGGLRAFDMQVANPRATYDAYLRELLHLERPETAVAPALGVHPDAPDFRVRSLDGDWVELSALRGKVVVLVFFLPTCPHCHHTLKFLQGLEAKLANPDLEIVALSISNRPYVIENMQSEQSIDLAIYVDPDGSTQQAYEHHLGVPDTVVIDREGRIIARTRGAEPRVEALLTMAVRQALGVSNPLLLSRTGYSGDEVCAVCHEQQYATWSLTSHAYAFETLAEHGSERDPECLACHTVGWDQPGGYSLATPLAHLQGVQCENCHGRGGPHQSPDFATKRLEDVCLTCHNATHSLNFVFAERLPLVSHALNLQFTSLSRAERAALLERRDRRERTLFPKGAYVGSDACRDCHAPQYEVWSTSAHASAWQTLEGKGETGNSDCVTCHVTGFEEQGGYPEGGDGLRNVGCESCHGPGANHVAEGAAKKGTILALADKCDSCVILQICGSCHDQSWDPDFEFKLEPKLERIRHGMLSTARRRDAPVPIHSGSSRSGSAE